MRHTLTRRRMLRGAAGVAVGLPWLEASLSSNARACSEGTPKRLIVMYSGGSGTVYSAWQPSGVGNDFSLSPILQPLQPHIDDLVVLSGIDNESCNHQAADFHTRGFVHMLTNQNLIPVPELNNGFGDRGYAGGPSVDQYIAQRIGGDTRFESLLFGVSTESFWGAHPNSRMSYAAANEPVPAEDDPEDAFNRIFSDIGADPAELDRIRQERRSILDFVLEDFDVVKQQVGSEDRERLEAHMDRVRTIEQGIDLETVAGCVAPGEPSFGNPHDNALYPDIGRAQTDLLVAALACDQTRVATLQWSHGQSEVGHPWLGGSAGSTHHGLSHSAEPHHIDALIDVNRWYAEQLAYLIAELKAVPEGDGTLFDHTLILWANEMGEGRSHDYNRTPWLLAGSCCNAVSTGQHLDFGDEPHGRVLVTVLGAMGLPDQTFGIPEFSAGPLPGVLA